MASVLGLELHHPILRMLWGHVGRSKRKRETNKESISVGTWYTLINYTITDICTHHLISRLSTNFLVAEASISYVEHVRQMLMFSHNVLHEERHLGNSWSRFINKNKRVLVIRRRPLATTQNRKNRKIDTTQCQKMRASDPNMGPKLQQSPGCCNPPP